MKIIFTLACFLLPLLSSGQVVHKMYFNRFSHYTIDDWITYAPATDITSIDVGLNYMYFGTRSGGILRYHLYDNYWDYPFTTSNGLRNNRILYLAYDSVNHLLFAQTRAGIDVYNFAFDYWEPATNKVMPERRKPPNHALADYNRDQNFRFPEFYRPSLSELPDFFTAKPFLFRPPDEILDEFNRVFNLNPERVVDDLRNLWLSTNGLGVGKADLDQFFLSFYQKSISNISPRDILFDGDNTWIAGFGNGRQPAGITNWQIKNDQWSYYEARYISTLYNDNITSIAGDGRYIFFGSELGLARLDKKTRSWRSFTTAHRLLSEEINDLLVHDNRLYIASDAGLNWLEIGSDIIKESRDQRIINIPVFQLMENDSTILMATRDGIYEYIIEKDYYRLFPTKSALLDVGIRALGSQNDSIWFAGDNGIVLYDVKNKAWRSFPQIQNQLLTTIYDIDFTSGHVWFATDDGLLKYDVHRDYWYLYTTKDGLASNRIYHIDPFGDELWLSTWAGVTIFRWYRPGRVE